MAEQEFRAQFEREYCEQFPIATRHQHDLFMLDACGDYAYAVVGVGYAMWKRAKLEVRTVELKVWPNVFMQDQRYAFADDIKNALEKANVKVEFV